MDTDIGQLDCLGHVLGIGDFSTVKERSIQVELGGLTCRIIDLDALIEAKRAMGRERDMAAVRDLEAIKERMNEHD